MAMSSSSHARVTSRSERRTAANDNGSTQPRAPSALHGGIKSERADPRRTQSPPASSAAGHRRAPSGSQRNSKNVEERRTERVQITTKETITRARSPERRAAPPPQPSERSKPVEQTRSQVSDRPKSKAEVLQGKVFV